ncbi:MAG: ester cyclase [Pseudomonadota bacterium]
MNAPHDHHKAQLEPLRAALYDFDHNAVERALRDIVHDNALIQLGWPFETLADTQALLERAYSPLASAWPDLERRDQIIIAGSCGSGAYWVGCCGYYLGTFARPWLNIPPTQRPVAMRYHEFFRFVDERVVEIQAVWDIPEVMQQAGVWPLAPALGREWRAPGPATQDGKDATPRDAERSAASVELVNRMLIGLSRFAEGGAAAMELPRYWHPRCSWYGPSGIGTARGIDGFRMFHQIPFLNGMPDRVGSGDTGHLFGDNDYVGFTAWPGMHMTLSGDGWLGVAPAGQPITMRSLDFWRCENGLIRENWVLIDLLDVFRQLGVDVLARMRELSNPGLDAR